MDTDKDYTGKDGWCGNPRHSTFMHTYASTCFHFVSDEEETAKVMEAAKKHDAMVARLSGYNKEAAYVAQHRPY